jgi:hypothetical protein
MRKGQPCSEETKRKIGQSNRGREVSAATRAKLARANIGRRDNPEVVAKRVESQRNSPKIKNRSRYLALSAGEKFYVPEIPCKRGHLLRDVKFMECVQCQLDKQRAPSYRSYSIWWTTRDRAKKLGLPFNLTREYIERIWPEDEMCPIFGVKFESLSGPSRGKGHPHPHSASIDRIIPEKGYVEGNVAIISNRANTMKHNCSDPEVFRKLADWLEKRISLC